MSYRFASMLLMALSTFAFAVPASGADVIVTVVNIELTDIPVKLDVIDKPAFASSEDEVTAIATVEGRSLGDTIQLTITDLPAGEYAIQAYQDLNQNGKMDFGIFGPKEPIGLSGNPRISILSPPSWKKIKVIVDKADVDVKIKLKN